MGGEQVVSIIDADMVIRSDFYQRMLPYLQTERDALVLAPQVRTFPVWELGHENALRLQAYVQVHVISPGHATLQCLGCRQQPSDMMPFALPTT